jgi:hypothetical protein
MAIKSYPIILAVVLAAATIFTGCKSASTGFPLFSQSSRVEAPEKTPADAKLALAGMLAHLRGEALGKPVKVHYDFRPLDKDQGIYKNFSLAGEKLSAYGMDPKDKKTQVAAGMARLTDQYGRLVHLGFQVRYQVDKRGLTISMWIFIFSYSGQGPAPGGGLRPALTGTGKYVDD